MAPTSVRRSLPGDFYFQIIYFQDKIAQIKPENPTPSETVLRRRMLPNISHQNMTHEKKSGIERPSCILAQNKAWLEGGLEFDFLGGYRP